MNYQELTTVASRMGLTIREHEHREFGQRYYGVWRDEDTVEMMRFFRCNEDRALADMFFWLDGYEAAMEIFCSPKSWYEVE